MKSIKIKREPSGRLKTKPNENAASRAHLTGNVSIPKIRGSANRQSNLLNREIETLKVDASLNRDCFDASLPHTVKTSPSRSGRPAKENDIPDEALMNSATTFVDSVLSLCMKSATSCSDNGFMEFGFIGLIKECGFVEAKCWAESLGIPHEHSARLLSLLMFGPRRCLSNGNFQQVFTPE